MSNDVVCNNCGHIGESVTARKGHRVIEIALWLLFLVPGIIYSIWRLTTWHEICPVCGSANLIPASSPIAQRFIRENFPGEPYLGQYSTPPPSEAARSIGKALGRLVGKVFK